MRYRLFGVLIFLFIGLNGFATGNGVVKIVHAEGRIYYSEIYVIWSTEYEKAPCDFIVEASKDGTDWRIRGRVKSKGGLTGISDYQFVDEKQDQYKFYRIRRNDSRNGNEVLSQFELENYSIDVQLEAFDVFDSKRLVLDYSVDKDQVLMIRIFNRIGEQVMTKVMPFDEAGDYIVHIDISHLRKDNYLLQVNQVLLDKTVAERAFQVN